MRYLFVLLLLLAVGPVHAEDIASNSSNVEDTLNKARDVFQGVWGAIPNVDPIQHKLHECEKVHFDNASVPICYGEAENSYKQLLQELVEENKDQLGDTQVKWNAYSDADDQTIEKLVHKPHGTILGSEIATHKLHLIRERIADIVVELDQEE